LGARCGVRLSSQNFRQCRSTATQNYSLLAIRQSLPFLALTGGSCSRTTENKFGCSGEQPSSFVPARPKFFGTAEPCPPEKPSATCYSPFTIRYRFGFNWRVVLPHDRKQIRLLRRAAFQFRSRTTEIFRHGRAVPSRKTIRHSPLAIRYSLPFRLGRSLAFPIHSVPRPPSHAPF
jgi:hypothetical protein